MSDRTLPFRHLPVRPDLEQLRHQAKDLLRDVRAGVSAALADFEAFHPDRIDPSAAKLADAQLVLARSYHASSWTRLVQACHLIDAIWQDDLDAVREIVTRNPRLIHEDARIQPGCNWGPPMSYAANLGRDDIIRLLHDRGATDLERALDRAALQGQIATARMLHELMGNPTPSARALEGPAYTLSVTGTKMLLDAGARVVNDEGERVAPVNVVIESDSRHPSAKHAILEMYEQRGLVYPDTPIMALHRGRIDLLEAHLRRDPLLLQRTFTHREIYPAELGCHDALSAAVGTPLHGTTLLHMCVDYDEMEIARWLLDQGMNVNARGSVDEDGFGGFTALFCAVVSQPNFWTNRYARDATHAPMTELLLEHGADVNVRASLWKEQNDSYEVTGRHEFRDVTALSWGRRYHTRSFVSAAAMRLIEEAGGVE